MNKNEKYRNFKEYFLLHIYLGLSIFETYINTYIGHICALFMLLYTVFIFITSNKKLVKLSKKQFLFFCFALYAFVSLLWSENKQQAIPYIFTFATMMFLVIAAEKFTFNELQIDRAMFFFQLCSMVLCILGLFYSSGLDANNSMRYVLTLNGRRMDPNYLLALYIIRFQIGLYRILFIKTKNVINVISIAVSAVVIFMTGSRSGVVLLALSIGLLIWGKLLNVNLIKKMLIVLTMLVALVAAFNILESIIPAETYMRILGLGSRKFTDSAGRFDTWEQALSLWKESFANVILGAGFGGATTHSTIITFLLEYGILGFGLFSISTISLGIMILKEKNYLAMCFFLSGLIQAFLCPATNMRFFWNALVIPTFMINTNFGTPTYSNQGVVSRRYDLHLEERK